MKITTIPQIYRHVGRWGEILAVLSKYGLADWLSRFESKFAKDFFKNRDGEALARLSRETRIRLALTELGPTFIKLGQILSTRPDLVGTSLADELTCLQDEVPADPPEVVRTIVEAELGRPVNDAFACFCYTPLASASIGQVHAAQLHTGDEVVVKVQHANIQEKVRVDLDVLAGLAQIAERAPEMAAFRPRATVAEFQRTLRRELDFSREERNLRQFARIFADDPTVCVPRSYPELSTCRVLTMQRLGGVKLSESELINPIAFDLEELARRGANIYLHMIFAHGAYHADPHPGNIMLLEGNVIGLLDFGMVGRIDDELREDVEEMLLALSDRDATRLTSIITRIGATPPNLDRAALSVDVADFVSHYANQPLDEFDLSGALREMMDIMRHYHIMLPARIALLLKVLIMLEGSSRLLSPRFNLMEIMRPHRAEIMRRRLSPVRRAKRLWRIYSEFEDLAEIFPQRMREILQQVQTGRFDVHLDHRGLEPSVNRLVLGMITSALFLGSALLLGHHVPPVMFGEISVLGALGCAVSIALGLRLIRAINQTGHLERRRHDDPPP